MTLLDAGWLLLAVPCVWLLRRWPPPSGWRRGLRYGFVLLLLLALCRPALWLSQRAGAVVVLVDRSASMPDDHGALASEVIRRLEATRQSQDRLAVLAFGEQVAVETTLDGPPFANFHGVTGDQLSRLSAAVERGLAMAPPGGRLLVLSDGRHTDDPPQDLVGLAKLRRVAIDYRLLTRPAVTDLAIAQLDVPLEVSPGEGFLLTAWIESSGPQEVGFELWRGDQRIAEGTRPVPSGRSRLTFRDLAGGAGTQAYRLVIDGQQDDDVEGNNTARFLVSVRGPRPLLLITEGASDTLARLLRAGGLEVQLQRPEQLSGSLEDLAGYAAVILENVGLDALGDATAAQIEAWVRQHGAGLMITGGRRSYGLGGYYGSPLEEALPVSMEMRQEQRKLPLAIAVVLDRSGSMAAGVSGGLDKMDLANRATVEVLELLTPMDELAVIAVDSAPYVVQPLTPVTDIAQRRREILEIDAMGGGIFVYEGLHAASRQLLAARAQVRHILLFADTEDAEEPGAYEELLANGRRAGITVSVVGLGSPMGVDAELLRRIADLGGGQIYFTESAEALPRLFAQDTFLISRSAFLEEPTAVRLTAGYGLLGGQSLPTPPSVGGYNLTYLRPEAQLVGVTEDQQQAPWLVTWAYGLGRVVAVTSEVDGDATGAIGHWPPNGRLWTTLARWAAGRGSDFPQAVVTQRLDGGQLHVQVHLDPQLSGPLTSLPKWRTLRGVPGSAPQAAEGEMTWRDPFTLESRLDLEGEHVALTTVELPGRGRVTLPAVRLPYSPELRPDRSGDGHRTLEGLAKATGGRHRLDVGSLWQSFPRQRQTIEVTPWLLALASLPLLLEILERRTALLSSWSASWGHTLRRRSKAEGPADAAKHRAGVGEANPDRPPASDRKRPAEPATGAATASQKSEITPQPEPPRDHRAAPGPGLSDALSKARQRAERRQRRG